MNTSQEKKLAADPYPSEEEWWNNSKIVQLKEEVCTAPIRLDTKCVVVSSYRVDLTAAASIGFQTRLE